MGLIETAPWIASCWCYRSRFGCIGTNLFFGDPDGGMDGGFDGRWGVL